MAEVVALGVVQKQVQRFVYPVDLTAVSDKLGFICQRMHLSKAEALRKAVNYFLTT